MALKYSPSPRGLARRRWLLLGLGVLVTAALFALAPTLRSESRTSAFVHLHIRANAGGIATNSYSDAAVVAVMLTEPNTLARVRAAVPGGRRTEMAALASLQCVRNAKDSSVTCKTTGTNPLGLKAALNQLVKQFIPIDVQTQVAEFHEMIRNLKAQRTEIAGTDGSLREKLASLQLSGTARAGSLDLLEATVRQNESIRRQIVIHERSIRKQIKMAPHTILAGPVRVTTPPTTMPSAALLSAAFGLAVIGLGLLASHVRCRHRSHTDLVANRPILA